MKRPSKKIIILIVCAFIVISLVVYNKIQSSGTSMIKAETAVAEEYGELNYNSELEKNISILDTDGDGLPDWQEVITNTDPHNTDTDGDGTDDGKELELGRDPTIAGPNDKLDRSGQTSNTSNNTSADITISEEVSKNLFANAVYLSNNDELTEENVATLVDNLISGVENTFTFKEYMESDLPIIAASKEDIRFFASSLSTLQYELLNQLMSVQDPKKLSEIYNKHANDLYTLKTPFEIASVELKIINNFSKISSVYDAFSKQSEDPLKLPLAVKAYQEAGIEQFPLIKEIGMYLERNDIINLLDENAKNYWTLVLTAE